MRGFTGNILPWRGVSAAVVLSVFASISVTAYAATEKVVYAFKGGSDGANPQSALLDVKGELYGTTAAGGLGTCSYQAGCGTVFKIAGSGREKVVYSFQGGRDGYAPTAGLINVKGTFYGTTSAGISPTRVCAASNCGTIFSITPSGGVKVLHVFTGGDGAGPDAELIDVRGTLYGTTVFGGSGSCVQGNATCGTVFSIAPSGAETGLFSFNGADGFGPLASLVNINGTLFGTTLSSGKTNLEGACAVPGLGFPMRCGLVFSITPGGVEKVIHKFQGGTDGGASYAPLIDYNGTLYGTTSQGGTGTCNYQTGCGTVFEITAAGKEKVLYSFQGGSDGGVPVAGLIDVNGVLYGTTQWGGDSTTCPLGCGTVFSITTSGDEKVLYAFKAGSDGALPQAGLINVNGTLYGTTEYGGAYGGALGFGTVFSITP